METNGPAETEENENTNADQQPETHDAEGMLTVAGRLMMRWLVVYTVRKHWRYRISEIGVVQKKAV